MSTIAPPPCCWGDTVDGYVPVTIEAFHFSGASLDLDDQWNIGKEACLSLLEMEIPMLMVCTLIGSPLDKYAEHMRDDANGGQPISKSPIRDSGGRSEPPTVGHTRRSQEYIPPGVHDTRNPSSQARGQARYPESCDIPYSTRYQTSSVAFSAFQRYSL